MGKNQRRNAYKPLSQKAIKRIMNSNPQATLEITPRISCLPDQPCIRLTRHMEYDSLNPEEIIAQFVAFLSDCKSRYDEDMRLIDEYQLQKQDLDHFAEMAENLDRTQSARFYRTLRDVWRKRRQCKNEAELLRPVIDFIESNKDALNQLPIVQGKIRQAREIIDQREYLVRTSVLDDMLGNTKDE